jgi:uncharacterized membrane protein YkoI
MMRKRSLPALALLLFLSGFGALDALAARNMPAAGAPGGPLMRVAERAISMGDAISRVRRQTGGRVLDAQDKGSHYRVKVLTPQGEVRVFRVDAMTGAVR